jgi:hypothetical protein
VAVPETVIAAATAVQARIVRPLILPPRSWSARSNRSRRIVPRRFHRSGAARISLSGAARAASCGEPADERTEHEPGLRCEGDVGGQADDDADRQAEHGSKSDGGSDAHLRECTSDASARRLRTRPLARRAARARLQHPLLDQPHVDSERGTRAVRIEIPAHGTVPIRARPPAGAAIAAFQVTRRNPSPCRRSYARSA